MLLQFLHSLKIIIINTNKKIENKNLYNHILRSLKAKILTQKIICSMTTMNKTFLTNLVELKILTIIMNFINHKNHRILSRTMKNMFLKQVSQLIIKFINLKCKSNLWIMKKNMCLIITKNKLISRKKIYNKFLAINLKLKSKTQPLQKLLQILKNKQEAKVKSVKQMQKLN